MTSTSKLADIMENLILDFRETLEHEASELSSNLAESKAETSHRIKTLVDFFKIIQGVELISKGVNQQREHRARKQIEIVEFRRQLEEQIAKLVDAETSGELSKGT